jgi:hypothetical protein
MTTQEQIRIETSDRDSALAERDAAKGRFLAVLDGLRPAPVVKAPVAPTAVAFKTQAEALAAYNKLPNGMEGAKARALFRETHKKMLGL